MATFDSATCRKTYQQRLIYYRFRVSKGRPVNFEKSSYRAASGIGNTRAVLSPFESRVRVPSAE